MRFVQVRGRKALPRHLEARDWGSLIWLQLFLIWRRGFTVWFIILDGTTVDIHRDASASSWWLHPLQRYVGGIHHLRRGQLRLHLWGAFRLCFERREWCLLFEGWLHFLGVLKDQPFWGQGLRKVRKGANSACSTKTFALFRLTSISSWCSLTRSLASISNDDLGLLWNGLLGRSLPFIQLRLWSLKWPSSERGGQRALHTSVLRAGGTRLVWLATTDQHLLCTTISKTPSILPARPGLSVIYLCPDLSRFPRHDCTQIVIRSRLVKQRPLHEIILSRVVSQLGLVLAEIPALEIWGRHWVIEQGKGLVMPIKRLNQVVSAPWTCRKLGLTLHGGFGCILCVVVDYLVFNQDDAELGKFIDLCLQLTAISTLICHYTGKISVPTTCSTCQCRTTLDSLNQLGLSFLERK